MATNTYYQCVKCEEHSYPSTMFEPLRQIADGTLESCSKCAATRILHLDFQFATDGSSPRLSFRSCGIAAP